MNQTGMRRQLVTLKQLTQFMIPKLYTHLEKSGSDEFFFLFRQLLVWFKREFSWDDVCTLWEVLWTDFLSGQFHLFIALAILDRHKEVIMGNSQIPHRPFLFLILFSAFILGYSVNVIEHLREFDEVLKYINDLSMTIDLDSTLVRAEVLFYRFQGTVELIDRKNAERVKQGKEIEGQISEELRGLLKKEYPKE
jgi:TBC1 domain family member 15